MRVGVDVDDVLYPWYATAHRVCSQAGITNGIMPVTWACYDEYGITFEEWQAVLSESTLDGSLYYADPYHGTRHALSMLKHAGHSVHLVTARGTEPFWHNREVRAHTYLWVSGHLADLVDSLTFSADKTVVQTDVFVDDSLRNYDALEAYGTTTAYVLDQPWNRTAPRPGRSRRRVHSLTEFAQRVLMLERDGVFA